MSGERTELMGEFPRPEQTASDCTDPSTALRNECWGMPPETSVVSESAPPAATEQEKESTRNLGRTWIKDEDDRERFEKDIDQFSKRALSEGLKPQQIEETYRQVRRLMSIGETFLPFDQRIKMAQQVMHHAAQPTSIDQGMHQTCALTVIEVRTYARHPEKAARLVSDIALNNVFVTADGTRVGLDAKSAQPDDESKQHPARDGKRDYASQIFQLAAANVHAVRTVRDHNGNTIPKGSRYFIQWEELRRVGKALELAGRPQDTGERLLDMTDPKAPRAVSLSPEVHTGHVEDVAHQITGVDEKGFVLENEMYGAIRNKRFNSESGFANVLSEVADAKNFPAILRIHDGHQPFNVRPGGWHSINVLEYDSARKRVHISNQWGKASDIWVSVESLYKATLPYKGSAPPIEWHPQYRPGPEPDTRRE